MFFKDEEFLLLEKEAYSSPHLHPEEETSFEQDTTNTIPNPIPTKSKNNVQLAPSAIAAASRARARPGSLFSQEV